MIINKINDNGSGPWGSGGGNNPWGKRPNSNGTPPDVDQMLKEGKEKFKKMILLSKLRLLAKIQRLM